jgi:cyclase
MATGVIKLQRINKGKLNRARELRSEMTAAESIVWERLRRKQLGVKFRRQQLIEGFIADFFCEEAALVIEIDGAVHETAEQQKIDLHRRVVFESRGLKELRFTNSQVVNNIDFVVSRIQAEIPA